MDQKQQSPFGTDAIPFAYPSSAEIDRLIAEGRLLRAQATTDLIKATIRAIRRAFGGTGSAAERVKPAPSRAL